MFHKEIAEEFGLAEATLFYHIAYWVRRNRKEQRNYRDGKYWTYNAHRNWQMERTSFYLCIR